MSITPYRENTDLYGYAKEYALAKADKWARKRRSYAQLRRKRLVNKWRTEVNSSKLRRWKTLNRGIQRGTELGFEMADRYMPQNLRWIIDEAAGSPYGGLPAGGDFEFHSPPKVPRNFKGYLPQEPLTITDKAPEGIIRPTPRKPKRPKIGPGNYDWRDIRPILTKTRGRRKSRYLKKRRVKRNVTVWE